MLSLLLDYRKVQRKNGVGKCILVYLSQRERDRSSLRAVKREVGNETETVMAADRLLFDQWKGVGDVLDSAAAC